MLIVGMAALMVMAARGVRLALPLIVLFVACDQGLWGYSYAYRWGPIQRIDDIAVDVPAGAQRGDLIAPAIVGGIGNVAVLRGFRLTPGYSGLVASSVLDPANPVAHQIAGVAWRETGYTWERVTHPMARARLVASAQTSADIDADVRRVDVARVALVESPVEGLAGATDASGDRGSAQIVEDRPGSIVVDTASATRQLLVLTERFHGGWRATQDKAARVPIRVYGDFLGCVVDAGRHRVALTFAPASAAYGRRATLAGVVLTAVATMVLWRVGAGTTRERDRPVRT